MQNKTRILFKRWIQEEVPADIREKITFELSSKEICCGFCLTRLESIGVEDVDPTNWSVGTLSLHAICPICQLVSRGFILKGNSEESYYFG
jgi:hypothetical protein